MGLNDEMMNPMEEGTTEEQLNLTYLLDTSGSMIGEKINQLNIAMQEAVDVAEESAAEMEVQLRMRVIEFNNGAKWICGTDEMNGLDHIDWQPLSASGGTATADAIRLAKGLMSRKFLGTRNYKPVVILITDGESNSPADTVAAVNELKTSLKSTKNPNADKIIRIAIGVKGANQTELENFASVGNIIDEDGSTQENVPFVFPVDNISLLKSLLKNVTISSIASSIGAGTGEEQDLTTLDMTEDEWV
jgi:uncharacterized protein YegL